VEKNEAPTPGSDTWEMFFGPNEPYVKLHTGDPGIPATSTNSITWDVASGERSVSFLANPIHKGSEAWVHPDTWNAATGDPFEAFWDETLRRHWYRSARPVGRHVKIGWLRRTVRRINPGTSR
jgi:hypothetical protein